ncbi:bifunctional riboflavin kinase/FAD synthetase [Pleurocapsales cyanobacterium LEGE 06147]|nr:bifunctional riboflavin kinase/FAD synthetase [Pleurocapsales cyanobacterium LEGE 06147]
MWIAAAAEKVLKPTAIALGNFDGIHRGHQKILQPILSAVDRQGEKRVYPTVVSFHPHPREFFTGEKIYLLTPITEKAKLLERLGIEQLVLLPFNQELAFLSPQQFVAEILVKQLQATQISVGEDFRFGYQRRGTVADLEAIASNFGIEVHVNSLYKCFEEGESVRISSSRIRQALEAGKVKKAKFMLGRPYTLMGTVVQGQQLGRTIGFPTANLQLPPDKFLPRYGVYSVNVAIDPTCFPTNDSPLKGVMNIGRRPTVEGSNPTVEVHLLDWSGDLYGRTLTVSLERFLRPEQKFSSLEALKKQIAADCEAARFCRSS